MNNLRLIIALVLTAFAVGAGVGHAATFSCRSLPHNKPVFGSDMNSCRDELREMWSAHFKNSMGISGDLSVTDDIWSLSDSGAYWSVLDMSNSSVIAKREALVPYSTPGYALDYDGSNDYSDCQTTPWAGLSGSQKLSVAMWFNADSVAINNTFFAVTDATATANGLWCQTNSSTTIICGAATTGYRSTSATVFTAGVWTHLAVVFDGTQASSADRIKIYINASRVDTSSGGTPPTQMSPTVTPSFYIARFPFYNRYFAGLIDEVSVYSNSAITSTDINTLYAAGAGYYQTGGETGITNLWHKDEGTFTTVGDSKGTTACTATNGPAWVSGKVLVPGTTPAITTVWQSGQSGVSGENGQNTFGDDDGGTQIDGKRLAVDIEGNQTFDSSGTQMQLLAAGQVVTPGVRFPRVAPSGTPYNVTSTDLIVDYPTLAAARSIVLQAATTAGAGRIVIVKDAAGAAATYNLTVSVSGCAAACIDAGATHVINTNYGVGRYYSTGTKWAVW